MHHLERLVQFLPMERGAQHGVPVQHGLPRAFERHEVDFDTEPEAELFEVGRGIGRRQGVKKDAFLQRRQRIDPLDRWDAHRAASLGFATAATSLSRSLWLIPAWAKSDGVKPARLGNRQCATKSLRCATNSV